jgi:acylphosphatase
MGAGEGRSQPADEPVRALVSVRGRVQGVGFRYATEQRARSLGLHGWVRNRSDGSVEALFEGGRDRVESMLDWCRRGPAWARPEEVNVEWQQPVGEQSFRIR